MYKFITVLALSVLTLANAQAQDSLQNKAVKPAVKPATVKPAVQRPYSQQRRVQTTPAPSQAGGTVPVPQTNAAPAQTPAPQNVDKSLSGQYQYILSKTYHYQQPVITAFWKNVRDTMAVQRKKVKELSDKLASQSKSTTALQNDLTQKSQSLDEATSKRDEISFLGMGVPKTTYNSVMWGAVAVLAIALVIVVLRTGSNRREAKYRTKLYDELSDEFQAYKVKANEKEKKLARELQTERNKVDELMGRG